MKKSLSLLLMACFAIATVPGSARADDWHGHSTASYVGTALANPIYFPAKVAFALVGGITSGIAYVATLGNTEPSHEIWAASVEGDYVVTPSMIDGHRDVDFIGPS
ncbi:MAG TPA: hypothetical protein VMR86_20275 [Myxococcota bacterium]|nr:hypothetical protein [Myxococcota bacterium]